MFFFSQLETCSEIVQTKVEIVDRFKSRDLVPINFKDICRITESRNQCNARGDTWVYPDEYLSKSLHRFHTFLPFNQKIIGRRFLNMQKAARLKRELARLAENPPEGICCYPKDDKTDVLSVNIIGPFDTPYAGGIFQLEVQIPDRYPFEPPRIKFLTPVYHPNIDSNGLICMDLLKMPPKGGWKPTIHLENLLVAVQQLLMNPNPDDPLMADIAELYRFNKAEFERKAKQFTEDNAKKKRKNEFD